MASTVPCTVRLSLVDIKDRLAQLEQDMADVEQAMATLDELNRETAGRGGQIAADRINAVVSGERFPTEFSIRQDDSVAVVDGSAEDEPSWDEEE